MKKFRIVLLVLAMAIFAINFLAIDYQNLLSKVSIWAYVRIAASLLLVLLLVSMVRKDFKKR